MNYFELFELPVAPTVDKSKISKKYFELQKKYHPDFFSDAGNQEKEEVMLKSAMVNDAYKTFQDGGRTIEYFLRVTGILETDEKYDLPKPFLMEMMEINESLNEDELHAKSQIEEFEKKLWDEVKPVIEHYANGITTGTELQQLKLYYFKKKYLKRILDRLAD
jgi:molecular chaperone HscB